MPKITVWKCPHTKKLFEVEAKYRNHLKRLSRERIAARKWQAVRDSVTDVIAGAAQVNNVQELVDYVIKHKREFMIQGVFNGHWHGDEMHKAMDNGWDIYFPEIQSLTIDTTWRTEVSNSHNCPRDGYTNWGGDNKEDKSKRHYPGWHGKIEMSYNKEDCYIIIQKPGAKKQNIIEAPSVSDMVGTFGDSMALSGICTGGGGGGHQNHSYQVSLFQSDFSEMEKAVTFAVVAGNGEKAHWGSGLRYKELDEIGSGKFYLKETENV